MESNGHIVCDQVPGGHAVFGQFDRCGSISCTSLVDGGALQMPGDSGANRDLPAGSARLSVE